MKGLLLKDLYMMKKYCKSYLLITVLFIALSFASNENLFFVFYPCLLCGMIPVNLLGYDERSRWLQYSETMPYTKGQIVSGKYWIGLGTQVAVLLVTGFAQAIRMNISGAFALRKYLVLMMLLLVMSLLASSITLPFMFKLGVEKGRMAYYIMIGIVCAGSIIASNLLSGGIQAEIKLNGILPIICLVGIGIYVLSWYLSIVFYKKREI
ncbi:MAG: ABC-2 transporter permease [Ruminococcaceae bacterium]|nr:ABC-2 transporter permease [Oscillospiraceae bacterium]